MQHEMRAKFGLSLSTRAILFDWGTMDDLVDAAIIAEESGYFSGVWVGDNLLSKPRVEAIVTLSAIAARTERISLGTICLASFVMRDPVLLALQWASLDILSKGRTVLAVCNGGSANDGPQFAHELENMGVASTERVGRLVEGIQVIRRFWSEDSVTHHGRFYDFIDVEALPKPVQQPVPVLIAANPKEQRLDDSVVDRILRRVATYGDGWQTDATPVETFRQRFDRIREYAEAQGRDSSELDSCLHLMVNINDDRSQAMEEAQHFLVSYYGAGTISQEKMDLWLACGPPEEVVEKIQSYIDAGCRTPVLRFVSPDLKGQLQLCIQEVLPAFKAG
jgi:alkanesulfonate monooxygenase SsuD/methylene tetrahydromethanopterin reductase-like flavin-dependent oxidoreductase (luciferase family)